MGESKSAKGIWEKMKRSLGMTSDSAIVNDEVEEKPQQNTLHIPGPASPVSGDESSDLDWVDLGLMSGTLWASCNIGATKPEDYGDYFAQGATVPLASRRKNNRTSGSGVNDGQLRNECDAARANWGKEWYTPDMKQWKELLSEEFTVNKLCVMNGVNGLKVTSKLNGNSIFLPLAGFYYHYKQLRGRGVKGNYLTSSTKSLYAEPLCARLVKDNPANQIYEASKDNCYSVRAVSIHYASNRELLSEHSAEKKRQKAETSANHKAAHKSDNITSEISRPAYHTDKKENDKRATDKRATNSVPVQHSEYSGDYSHHSDKHEKDPRNCIGCKHCSYQWYALAGTCQPYCDRFNGFCDGTICSEFDKT